jgi:hypothetical protein
MLVKCVFVDGEGFSRCPLLREFRRPLEAALDELLAERRVAK